jgi:hypothetical protein
MEPHVILSIFAIARVENDGFQEVSAHLNSKDAARST